MSYDVFISYSHGDDDLLAERLQEGLTKFAKPWYRRRALNVFRDRTALSANPGLWSSIAEAIEDSRFLLVLASPDAAASVWCQREVEHWREKHGSKGLLVLLTDGEILWDEQANDFDWNVTNALGPAIAGAFEEEPFHVDMRWARGSAPLLDLTDGRFRDQVADLAAPVHGMAKDELASEDVRQHRRAVRQAVAAGIALALLTVAAVVTSVFAVQATARAKSEQHKALVQKRLALIASDKATKANALAQERRKEADAQRAKAVSARAEAERRRAEAQRQRLLAVTRANQLKVANVNLIKGGLALRKSTLLAEARLAARRSQQLMSSGDQTYQLGVALAAEAVRHACASSAIDPTVASVGDNYPDAGCAQPGVQIDGSVASGALVSLANAGGRFVTNRLAGPVTQTQNGSALNAWSAGGQRFVTYASAQSNRPDVVQVWNVDGTLAASATSAAGLTSDVALSGDGNVLALTGNSSDGSGAVSAWSVSSRAGLSGSGLAGRHPALSADGTTMAWLAPHGAHAIEIAIRGSAPRMVAVPRQPVGVAVSADGSLVAALVDRRANDYSLVPIDAATGRAGVSTDVGSFGTPNGSPWNNPPREVPTETVDPPAIAFAPSGSTVWIYNNERHVAAGLARPSAAPTATVAKARTIPVVLGGGDLTHLQTSTPDGRTVVFLNPNGSPTYQIWSLSPTGWTTPGVSLLELSSSNPANLSISPDGSELAVSSVSALQIINVRSTTGTSSGIVSNHGVVASGSAVVMGPSGGTALSWSPRSLVMIDAIAQMQRPVALPLGADEAIEAVGFDPSGARAVAIVGTGDACPCRVVVLDAATGSVVGGTSLGATALDRIPNDTPVGVTLNDSGDTVAVTFDDNAHGPSGAHRCGLATYALAGGQPLQAISNQSLGLGEQLVSVPAFQPGTNTVAIVATQGASREVGGALVDARSGAVVHTLSMRPGVVTVDPNLYGNDGYALRFTPDGRRLAWNTGGSVVVWDIGSASGSQAVQSDVVLTSSSNFDPSALAISDNGEVSTVGLNVYTDIDGIHGTYAVLTGDELGRFLQPLGIARLAPANGQPEARMSVAIPASGRIAAVALDFDGTRFFTDSWGAPADSLLSQLCASASRSLSAAEWDVYFPGEPYEPACSTAAAASAWDINASPPAVQSSAVPASTSRMPRSAFATRAAPVSARDVSEVVVCEAATPTALARRRDRGCGVRS